MVLLALTIPAGCGGSKGGGYPPDLAPTPSADDGRSGIGIARDFSRRIVFAADASGDGNDEVYTCEADGSDILRLTGTNAGDREPSWSPDRKRIVFVRTRDRGVATGTSGFGLPQRADLWVMNADGTNPKRIFLASENENDAETSYRYAAYPRFTTDGLRIIAAVFKEDATSSLRLFDGTAEVLDRPTPSSGTEETPTVRVPNKELSDMGGVASWSPDGQKLVFSARKDDARFRLFTLKRDGTDRKEFAVPPIGDTLDDLTSERRSGAYTTPAWSPDGAYIYFAGFVDTFDPATSSLKRTTGLLRLPANTEKTDATPETVTTGATDAAPAFAPGGERLIFTRRIDAGNGSQRGALFTCAPDGSDVQPLLNLEGFNIKSADW